MAQLSHHNHEEALPQLRKVALALGCNLGDRLMQLRQAVDCIRRSVGEVVAVSSVYENPAMLPENAPQEWDKPFYNMAVLVHSSLPIEDILALTQGIEKEVGRQQRPVWAPREMDIDILAAENEVLATQTLTVPHPGLFKRDFFILPMSEIWAEFKVNYKESIASLVDQARSADMKCAVSSGSFFLE